MTGGADLRDNGLGFRHVGFFRGWRGRSGFVGKYREGAEAEDYGQDSFHY